MIPWGLIAGAAMAALRKRGASESARPWWGYVAYALWVPFFVVGMSRWPASPWPALTVVALWALPWPLTRWVFIPLGWVRAAYFVASTAEVPWNRDHLGGGAVAAAWALTRKRAGDPAAVRWLQARLEKAAPLRGAGVVAMALVEAAQGRLDHARTFLRQVDALHEKATPPLARALAAEWLALDALERGAWSTVVELGRDGKRRTLATRFLGAAASRLGGVAPVAGRFQLWARWLLVSRPWRLWPLLRRALAAEATPPSTSVPDDKQSFPGAGPHVPPLHRTPHLVAALAHHAWVCSRDPSMLRPDEVERLASSWDAALRHPSTLAWCDERAAALGSVAGAALRGVEDAVVEDLCALARSSGAHVGEPLGEGVRSRLAWAVRNALLEEVEQACKALEERAEARRALPSPEEWRAWMALRRACERAGNQGGLGVRRLMYPTLNNRAVAWSVWLWNERKEHLLAHEFFRWMRDEAAAVGDDRAFELHSKNAACGF